MCITKDEFVVDVIWMAFMHCHLFTHWQFAKVEDTTKKYCWDHEINDDGA